ncbi:14-3-3 protein zeta-like [Ruditapes philippinarum]|uniref:14-3-3 protein zeta-like n=1 Tax=Ruditapes philippinarum TaxID=129788 RepID=UPI00295AC408|nr:14-3-3 protein zeta-like [Ruditapes philippinarum]
MDERRTLLERAKIAQEACRWNDMVEFMKGIVKLGRELSVEERNLLANAYKNNVGSKRAAWRVIMSIEQNIEGANRKRDISREYRARIEEELKTTCNEVLELIEKHLINTVDMENKIFYHKMQGDYYRYISEFSRDTANDNVFENAKIAYAHAFELCRENLSPAHPLRLGIILNFSVFYYEILEAHETACDMVKESLAAGEEDLHNITQSARGDSSVLLQLLEDNLNIWSAEMNNSRISTSPKYF